MLECIILYMMYNVLDVQLGNPEKVLVMYNETKLLPLGKCKVKIRNNKLFGLEFQVVDHDDRIPILARRASEGMQLIKVQYEDILMIDSERWRTLTESRYLVLQRDYRGCFTGCRCTMSSTSSMYQGERCS